MKIYTFKSENIKRNKKCATIYRMKRNVPVYIGECEWQPGSTRGAVHEVFNALIEAGEIPKSYFTLSVESWRGKGYYCDKVKDKGISIIEL